MIFHATIIGLLENMFDKKDRLCRITSDHYINYSMPMSLLINLEMLSLNINSFIK